MGSTHRLFECAGVAGLALAGIAAATPAQVATPAEIVLRVTNALDLARPGETVEVPASALAGHATPDELPKLRVTSGGRVVLSQAVDQDGDGRFDLLVFQADLARKETRAFTLQRGEVQKPRREDFRVYGRFVREREDDFAWENDEVAFRVYGQALESFEKEPLTSSAVDAWCKRTPRLVLNDWYLVDDYHRDHGEGGDFYLAGRTRGCGGSGILTPAGLAVARNFRSSRVLASGPIRLVFELGYPAWDAMPGVVETKRVTLDAGSHFNRFESRFEAPGTGPLTWAAGLRKARGASVRIDRQSGTLRTWERQDHYADDGWLGCAVVMDPTRLIDVSEADGNLLAAGSIAPGQPAVWYAGSAWDRAGQFPDADAWDRHVQERALRLASPLRVEIAAH